MRFVLAFLFFMSIFNYSLLSHLHRHLQYIEDMLENGVEKYDYKDK